MMNIVAVGNFTVITNPNHSVKAKQFKVASFHSRRSTRTICYAVEFLVLIVNNFNLRKVAFNLLNHFFDSKRFLRRFDKFAQHFKKFFFVFHKKHLNIF